MSRRLFQKIVAMITLLAITSSVAWATTPEVLLESMKDEAVLALHLPTSSEAQVAVATATTQADQHDQSLPEQPCNHGCHAASPSAGIAQPRRFNVIHPNRRSNLPSWYSLPG